MSDRLRALFPLLSRLTWWFTRIGGGIIAVICLLLGAWIALIDDPLGGEPSATAPVLIAGSPSREGATAVNDGAQPLPTPIQSRSGPQVLQVPQADPFIANSDEIATNPAEDGLMLDGPQFDARGGLEGVASPSLVDRFDADSFVPRMSSNGERPLDIYARPLEAGTVAPGQPRVAIIVGGLGLSQTSTQEVLNRLPPEITLAFAPYGNSLSRWASRARQDGHEYLMEVPMEPFDFPNNDPGPHTLQVALTGQANIERLHWALSRLPTPVGVVNYMGARFTSEEASVAPVVADIVERGLMIVDDGRSARSRISAVAGENDPVLRADAVIDARADQQAINDRLRQLETVARDRGYAVGVATALPLTISSLEEWSESLAVKGIALVPASSIVRF